MAMFLDPTIYFAFKRVFGNQAYPEITRAFLNALLGSRLEAPIEKIDFLDPFNQKEIKDQRYSIVDIKCTDQRKHQFIIEIQVKDQDFFPKRIQYYGAQAIARQLKPGDSFDAIMPVILISILGFDMLPFPEYLNSYSMQHDMHHSDELRLVSYVFVELKKFNKKLTQLTGIEEEWVYFIKHAHELNAIPKELARRPELEEAFELLKSGNLSEADLALYDKEVDMRRVDLNALAKAKNDGIAEGKAEAMLEFAKSLLTVLPIEIIAEKTGLSIDEIKKL